MCKKVESAETFTGDTAALETFDFNSFSLLFITLIDIISYKKFKFKGSFNMNAEILAVGTELLMGR